MSEALKIWRERLEAARIAEARAVSVAEQFGARKEIEEAEKKIEELEAKIKIDRPYRGSSGMFEFTKRSHPWQIKYDVSIASAGEDLEFARNFVFASNKDLEIQVLHLNPDPQVKLDYLSKLDAQLRSSHSIVLLLSRTSLPRLTADWVESALNVIRTRGVPVLALLRDVVQNELPPEFAQHFKAFFPTSTDAVTNANKFEDWCRSYVPYLGERFHISVPYLIISLKKEQIERLCSNPSSTFHYYGLRADLMQRLFDTMRSCLNSAESSWPNGYYGDLLEQWRPFGPDSQTIQEYIEAAVRDVNSAPPGREQRILMESKVSLRRYQLDEYLTNRFGSRDNLQNVCAAACLMVIDEFGLLHPELQPAIIHLLTYDSIAVSCLSASDPSYSSLPKFLENISHIGV